MSSTNRGQRGGGADDFFRTPAWCVRRLLEACPLPGGEWLEPAAGDGAIIRAVAGVRDDVRWTAVEKRDGQHAALAGVAHYVTTTDFLDWRPFQHFAVAITNPPYSLAQRFVEHALDLADNVAMLLRLNFLASLTRAAFMRECPPDVYVLPNRPSFRADGKTDSIEYAWFVWPPDRRRECGTVRVLVPTPAAEQKTVKP